VSTEDSLQRYVVRPQGYPPGNVPMHLATASQVMVKHDKRNDGRQVDRFRYSSQGGF